MVQDNILYIFLNPYAYVRHLIHSSAPCNLSWDWRLEHVSPLGEFIGLEYLRSLNWCLLVAELSLACDRTSLCDSDRTLSSLMIEDRLKDNMASAFRDSGLWHHDFRHSRSLLILQCICIDKLLEQSVFERKELTPLLFSF